MFLAFTLFVLSGVAIAAVTLELCVPVASTELRVMSSHPDNEFYRAMIRLRDSLSGQRVININAIDPLDPVHYRAHREARTEFDYDGDMGREHADYMRDNGHGAASVAGSFVQIADALPVIEAPSIVAELPEQAEQTVSYLARTSKAEG